MNNSTKNWLSLILLICILSFVIYMFYYTYQNIEAIKTNPCVYCAERIGEVMCSCVKGKNFNFNFNDTDFIIQSKKGVVYQAGDIDEIKEIIDRLTTNKTN